MVSDKISTAAPPGIPRRECHRFPFFPRACIYAGINLAANPPNLVDNVSFDNLVEQYYTPLYRFALSLARSEAEACDLTQQTFYLWATKGHQLRDLSKVKSWLFTTLYREFSGAKRHSNRFPHQEISEAESELPSLKPAVVEAMDANLVMEALLRVDDLYRAVISLFYIEQHSYREIAEVLQIPIGTVMSRLARGKEQLRELLAAQDEVKERKVVPMPPPSRSDVSHEN